MARRLRRSKPEPSIGRVTSAGLLAGNCCCSTEKGSTRRFVASPPTPGGAGRSQSELPHGASPEVAELVRQDPAGLLTLLQPVSGMGTSANAAAAFDGYVTADGLHPGDRGAPATASI